MSLHRRALAAAVGVAIGLAPVALLPTPPASAADPAGALGNVVINEVSSNGYTHNGAANTDFVELYNKGTTPIDLTGYRLIDNGAPSGAVELTGKIPPQGYMALVPPAFGIGSADQVRLFSPDGLTLIDSVLPDGTNWASHQAPSAARVPDGTGAFVNGSAPTPGGPNALTSAAESLVTINEVFSDGASTGVATTDPHDYVEIFNGGAAPIDLTGWYVTDGAGAPTAADRVTLGGATATVPAGGYLAVETEVHDSEVPTGFTYLPASNGTKSGYGLNKLDWVFLYKPDGTLVSTTFKGTVPDEHADTWSRLVPGTGLWANGADRTPGAVNVFPSGGDPDPTLDPNWDDIEINEIASLNDDDPGNPGFGDAVELVNTGDTAVSIEGWYQTDSGAASGAEALALADLRTWDGDSLEPAADYLVPAGGYVAFSSTKGLSGEGDSVKVYGPGADPAARQLVDEASYGDGDAGVSDTYESDSVAFAACPDGSDEFWRVTENSFGRGNTASCATKSRRLDSPVVLNEVSNTAGRAELLNTGDAPADISGWQLLDSTGSAVHTVPPATVLAAGLFYVADGITGLDSADSVTIRRPSDGATVVAHTWFEDGIASYSRCELFGDISYVETPTATWGAANACPSLDTQPWPGGATVDTVDDVNGFGDGDGNGEGDVSGAAFDPSDPSILWVVQNKNTLHKMRKVGGTYVAVAGWDGGKRLHFADGTGALDSEGVTVGPDGSLYITSERDNENSGVSHNKVARFDVTGVTGATTDLTAAEEWDVNELVVTGSNLGLEGITYVPDGFLVRSGWHVDGEPYAAADHPTPGLFVTAVEGTGDLHFFSLAAGAAPVEVKVERSGFPFAMDVTYDADRQRLWALCDDSCGGVFNVLAVVDGDLDVETSYARPAGMPNLNNEGMAIAPRSTCVDGSQEVVWADDGDTDGYSLRAGTLPCPAPLSLDPTSGPRIRGAAVVGRTLRAVPGAWTPVPDGATYQWLADGDEVAGATGVTLELTADLVGRRISVREAVAADGYPAAAATSTPTAKVAKGAARVRATVTPRRVTARTGTVTLRIAVSNPNDVPATGRVRVSGAGRVSGVLRNGRVVLELGPVARPGRQRLTIAYLGSEALKAASVTRVVRVVR